jgi:hypothetical protein
MLMKKKIYIKSHSNPSLFTQSHSHSLYDGQLLFRHADFGVQDLRRIGVNSRSDSMSIARDSRGWTGNSPDYSLLKWFHASSVQHILATLNMALLYSDGSGTPCTCPAQHACTHLVQLLLVDVVVVVRLRRHCSMLPPHGIEGAHQAGDIPPLSKDWSKSCGSMIS